MADTRELSLQKNLEHFLFRYQAGQEEDVLDAFVDMANDRGNNFDWFDAAVLSFQLSKHLVDEADKLLCHQDQPSFENSAGSEIPWSFP